MTTIEKKIQKKVDEINNLISLASNSESENAYDGNLMVTDTSSTWEEPAVYKPIIFRNGVLYIEYFEPYSNRTKKDKIFKRDLEYDGYGTLLDIAKIYRKALKKENIKYAGGGEFMTDPTFGNFQNNIYADGGEIRRFDRQAQMDSETREEILDVLSESDTPRLLTNYLYGLFDGYDYSKTTDFKKEVEILKRKNPKLHQRVLDIYKKIDKYKFEKYRDNYATGGGVKGDRYDGKTEKIVKELKNLKGGLDNKAPYVYQRDGFIYVSAEEGDNYADYDNYLYIDEKLEDFANKYDTYWDWENAGAIVLFPLSDVDEYAKGGVTENYVSRRNLNTITIKKGNQKLTYKISDVLNGAYKLESGAKLEDIAFYVPKRSIVKVQLKTGKDFKPANGYWIKDGAKPINISKFDEGGVMSKLLTRKKDQPKVETTDEDIDLNEDTRIRVRPSSFVRKDKEGDWMMKNNSSKEARSYAGGGSLINTLSSNEKLFFEKHFGKVSARMYTTDLKHYDETYSLAEVIAIIKAQPQFLVGGGKITFSEKAKAIAKNFEGKRVEPKYQKEYGKVYDKKEAKEVGNKIAGRQKASYDAKLEKGSEVKKGKGNHKMKEVTELAKKIRKDGEKWTDALRRAYQQMK